MRSHRQSSKCRAAWALLPARQAPVALLVIFANVQAHAAVSLLSACQPTDSPLVCRLRSVLAFLDTAAAVLGLLLLLAIVAALWTYRRKSRKLSPDEITDDAP